MLLVTALTGLPLVVLAVLGVALNRLVIRGEQAAFIMEMPLYHLPNWRTIAILVWQRLLAFLHKAGTVILSVSVIVWALTVLPTGEIETSYMGIIGYWLEPLGRLMGLAGGRAGHFTSFRLKKRHVRCL